MGSRELTAASSRPIILSLLASGERYGYEIIKVVNEASEGRVTWTEGMLYPVLHRMEREGLLTSRWKASESGRRRKYYRIKAAGRRQETKEREGWMAVHTLLTKIWQMELCPT